PGTRPGCSGSWHRRNPGAGPLRKRLPPPGSASTQIADGRSRRRASVYDGPHPAPGRVPRGLPPASPQSPAMPRGSSIRPAIYSFVSLLPAKRPRIPPQRREAALGKLPARTRPERVARVVQRARTIRRLGVEARKIRRRNPVVTFDDETGPDRNRRRPLRLKP